MNLGIILIIQMEMYMDYFVINQIEKYFGFI